jgi:superfamily II DNA or RNA helicase
MADLPFGLYEQLITAGLKARLLELDAHDVRVVRRSLDPSESHGTFARYLHVLFTNALEGLPNEDKIVKQAEIVNEIVRFVSTFFNERKPGEQNNQVAIPPEELLAIQSVPAILPAPKLIPTPLIALSDSDLLVNARGEPALVHVLAEEIPSADSIDLLCAFVRWHGVRVLQEQIDEHCRIGKPLRVITTVYTGSTERKALDWLVGRGAKVKISYDTQSARLHAKAWLFRRETGFSTAYIGSSNLTKAALIDGVEWNVRLSEVTSRDVLDKFDATFESYWLSPEYEDYDSQRDRDRFDRAVAATHVEISEEALAFLEVHPWPHQREMLEKLAVERQRHHRNRNLVVAATGTGKTIVAALDFKRLQQERGDLRLLFVAHRQEILRQSRSAFRQVLHSGTFGELYVDGHRPDEWRHVFASVQSLAHVDLADLDPSAFDVVIVDEFHHAAAPTYARLLQHLTPKILLALTATPERSGGEDILGYFDGHIAVELRLWDALERGLLCPFQYFGLHDNTDLSYVRWSRRGYDAADLERLYTADDARVRLVLQQLFEKHRDPHSMRALGFCVSINHAAFMARKFSEAGLPSIVVSADSDSAFRFEALADLRAGRLRALFAVDLFNEGVDLPEVDTLLFLRPTESALVFLQQLGRGLRRHDSKDCVTVLDFIGRSHRQFRFDLRYRAITGATRTEVEKQVKEGFPFLPPGCAMQLDRVATDIVLDNLRAAIPSRRPAMARELRSLMNSDEYRGRMPTLGEFLRESGLDLDDIYRSGCWSGLKREAGLDVPAGDQEEKLGKALRRLLHVDDPQRLDTYRRWCDVGTSGSTSESDQRLIAGLIFTLWGREAPDSLEAADAILRRHPAIVAELRELCDLLEERADHLTVPLDEELQWQHRVPLSIHARHSLVEILAAIGRIRPGHYYQHREGIFRDETTKSDLFFVTLEKSEREYSATTLYKDYAISPTRFHWQSQSTTSQASPTGQRYIRHRDRGTNLLLFVRERKDEDGRTVPYTFLGPVDYVSHRGERPISFIYDLRHPMPADFFRLAKVAAG